jgi:hypothetical protein
MLEAAPGAVGGKQAAVAVCRWLEDETARMQLIAMNHSGR